MNLTSPTEVRGYLSAIGVQPNRRLGQNFLIDRNILDRILDVADLSPTDIVVEIGPGLGVLTAPLIERTRRLLVVEKDRRLAGALQERFARFIPHPLSVTHADALDCPVDEFLEREGIRKGAAFKVVSNLPYSVASRLLVELAQAATPPVLMVVTVQLEVAQRLAAAPGSRSYGLLSLWMQDLFEIDIVKTVSPTCFWPKPQVKSAIVRLQRRYSRSSPSETAAFRSLTRYAFEHRRKQLPRLLEQAPLPLDADAVRTWLQEHRFQPTARPEVLSPPEWRQLVRDLAAPP